MWLRRSHLQRIDSALGTGPAADVDRILAEILAGASSAEPMPTVCAVCRRDLTSDALHQSGLLIYTCPAGHGAWLEAEEVATFQRLLHEGSTPQVPAWKIGHRLAVLLALLIASLAAFVGMIWLTPTPSGRVPASPMSADEHRYFKELMTVLDEGIVNRRNIDSVLKSPSEPDTYVAAYEIYRQRQERFLRRLDAVAVPDRLRPVHARIRTAAERQVAFYRDFTRARARNPADVPRMLGHPDLRASDYDLHTAWDLIRQIYPILAPKLAETIENHLCQLDVI